MVQYSPDSLGKLLSGGRGRKGLTLRSVETATGISNAYLSQLESGKVREPSPTLLHKLSELYGLSYAELLRSAGYPVPGKSTQPPSDGLAARIGPTTNDEEEALVEYLQFLRSRTKTGGRT